MRRIEAEQIGRSTTEHEVWKKVAQGIEASGYVLVTVAPLVDITLAVLGISYVVAGHTYARYLTRRISEVKSAEKVDNVEWIR